MRRAPPNLDVAVLCGQPDGAFVSGAVAAVGFLWGMVTQCCSVVSIDEGE